MTLIFKPVKTQKWMKIGMYFLFHFVSYAEMLFLFGTSALEKCVNRAWGAWGSILPNPPFSPQSFVNLGPNHQFGQHTWLLSHQPLCVLVGESVWADAAGYSVYYRLGWLEAISIIATNRPNPKQLVKYGTQRTAQLETGFTARETANGNTDSITQCKPRDVSGICGTPDVCHWHNSNVYLLDQTILRPFLCRCNILIVVIYYIALILIGFDFYIWLDPLQIRNIE